jgi:lactate permease
MDVGKMDRRRMWQIVSIILIVLYAVMFAFDWKFSLALFPLILVVVGMVVFRLGGATMAVIGWVVAVILAVVAFRTEWQVAILGSIEGLLKSLGIGVAVILTMYLIFLMKEEGLLTTVSASLKRVAKTREEQALFIGIGFGTFATSLGIVTPALFPPLLLAMGFTPLGAVAIAVLGYNASTSFALLSLPVTLPADVSPGLTDGTGFTGIQFAFFICLFLPVISIAISFAMLYIIGGRASVKKGAVPAFIVGAAVAFSCLGTVSYEYYTGHTAVPLRIVGVVAGLISMGALYGYQVLLDRWRERRDIHVVDERVTDDGDVEEALDWGTVLRAYSPLIILTVLAAIVGIKSVGDFLADLPGDLEVIKVAENKVVDLNILAQIYTWILIAILISIAYLRPKREVLTTTNKVWIKRIWPPFIAYSVFFAIAYVMAYSAMRMQDGSIVASDHFDDYNMNVVMAAGLAAAFGTGYMWISSSLGLFGAIVGGSETGSNVLFMNVQYQTANQVGILGPGGAINDKFMALYAGHGVAGGVASAITPSKVNNAVVTIGEGPEMEAQVMSKLLVVTIVLTVVINVMTGIMVSLF